MLYQIIHRTTYEYSVDVPVSHHVARLSPRKLPFQDCLEHRIDFEPHAAITTHHDDYFGNRTTFFSVTRPHKTLTVTARSKVRINRPGSGEAESIPWELVKSGFVSEDKVPLPVEVSEFAFSSRFVACHNELADYARPSFTEGRPILEAALDFTRRIFTDFKFDPKATTVATPLEQVMKNRRGVCQDFAHVQIGCLRSLGIPARYVSGYLETVPPPGKAKLVGSDASHAWVQVFIPPIGWMDFDPTNNVIPGERHITVAWGRDFDDVSPIRGVIVGGGKHQLSVAVDVTPLDENKISG